MLFNPVHERARYLNFEFSRMIARKRGEEAHVTASFQSKSFSKSFKIQFCVEKCSSCTLFGKNPPPYSPLQLPPLILLACLRITNNLVYYGFSFNTSSLSGDIFWNAFLSAAVEVPAYVVSSLLLVFIGRKPTFVGGLLLAGTSCFLCIPFLANKRDIYHPRYTFI